MKGHIANVALLLQKGANIDLRDVFGQTTLMAVSRGSEQLFWEIYVKPTQFPGTELDSTEITQLDADDEHRDAITHLLINNVIALDDTDDQGLTALCLAAAAGRPGIVPNPRWQWGWPSHKLSQYHKNSIFQVKCQSIKDEAINRNEEVNDMDWFGEDEEASQKEEASTPNTTDVILEINDEYREDIGDAVDNKRLY